MTASQTVPKPGDTILVTGASGFVAVHVVDQLLKEGFKVVGTVRSEAKGAYLVDLFEGKDFTYTIVGDIAQPGAFDEAVKGVQGIGHTASPFHFEADDPHEVIKPAVDGTLGILKSALKNGSELQRIVMTSSVAANLEPTALPRTFTDKDWNNFSAKEIEEKGKAAGGDHKYMASKVLAERAAWQLMANHPEVPWSLVSLNPTLVFGPILHQCDSPAELNTSVGRFFALLSGKKTECDLPGSLGNWVDVRDLAYAHVRALTVPEAGGERFLCNVGPVTLQDFAEWLHAEHPEVASIPTGKPGAAEEANDPRNVELVSAERAERVLGVKFRGLQETAADMFDSLKARGWVD